MHQVRKSRLALLLPALALTACVGGPPIVTASAAGCASLLPDNWRKPVEGADLPPDEATVGDWIVFGDQQTGKLDVANDRTISTISIYERCENRDKAAVKKAQRGFFGRLFD